MSGERCSSCKSLAVYELLRQPDKVPFSPPIYACIHGANIHGRQWCRPLPGMRAARSTGKPLPGLPAGVQ